MAHNQLAKHFDSFFGRLNPGPTIVSTASAEYGKAKALIESKFGLEAV